MDDNIKKLFYIEKSLNNYKYVFYLPKYSDAQRIELSSRIQAVGGRVTFSYNSENIIVIDNLNELKSANIKPHISNANLILVMESRIIKFYYDEMLGETSNKFDFRYYEEMGHEHYERFFPPCAGESKETKNLGTNYTNNTDNMNNNNLDDFEFYLKELPEKRNLKIYKLICYRDLIGILDEIEPFTIELQYRYGLPRNIDTSALISVVNFNEPDSKKLSYHSFAKIKTEKSKKNKDNTMNNSDGKSSKKEEIGVLEAYDLPFFDLKIDTGFSIFMSKEEKKTIDHYVSRKKNHKSSKEKANDKNNRYVLKSPEPRKDHNTCYVCNLKYDIYSEHIKSQLHYQSLYRNRDNFKRLNETFDRINNFWKEMELSKTEINIHKLKLGEDSSSIGMHLEFNNMTTADTISNLNFALTNKIINKNTNENFNIIQNHRDVADNSANNNNTSFNNILSNNFNSQAEYNYQNENNTGDPNSCFVFDKDKAKLNENKNSIDDQIQIINNNNSKTDKDNYFIGEMNPEENNNIHIEIQKNPANMFLNPFNKSSNLLGNNNNTSSNNVLINFSGINSSNNTILNYNNSNNKGKEEDFNEQYKRILNNKGNKTNKYLKDRPGMDYSLEKQIKPREESQQYLKRNKMSQNNLNSNLQSVNETSFKTLENSERVNNTGLLKSSNTLNTSISNANNGNENNNHSFLIYGQNRKPSINNVNDNKNYNYKNSMNENLLDKKILIASDSESICSNFSDNLGLESDKINGKINFLNTKINLRSSNNNNFASRQELLLKRNNLSLHSNNTSNSNTSGIINRELNSKFSYNNQKKMQSNLSLVSINNGSFGKYAVEKSNKDLFSVANKSFANSKKTSNNSISNVLNKRLEYSSTSNANKESTSNKLNIAKLNKSVKENDKSRLIKDKYLPEEGKIIAEEPASKCSIYNLKSADKVTPNIKEFHITKAFDEKKSNKEDKQSNLMDIEDDFNYSKNNITKTNLYYLKQSISNNDSLLIDSEINNLNFNRKYNSKSDILLTNPEVTFSRESSPKGCKRNGDLFYYDRISIELLSVNKQSESKIKQIISDVAVIIENDISEDENTKMNQKLWQLHKKEIELFKDKTEPEDELNLITESQSIENEASMAQLPLGANQNKTNKNEENGMLIEIVNNEKNSCANTSENYMSVKLYNPDANLIKEKKNFNFNSKSPLVAKTFLEDKSKTNNGIINNREKILRNSTGRNVNSNNEDESREKNNHCDTGNSNNSVINLKSNSNTIEKSNNSNYRVIGNKENLEKNNFCILNSTSRKLDFGNFTNSSNNIFNNNINNNISCTSNVSFINTKTETGNNKQEPVIINLKPIPVTILNSQFVNSKVLNDFTKQVIDGNLAQGVQDSSYSNLVSKKSINISKSNLEISVQHQESSNSAIDLNLINVNKNSNKLMNFNNTREIRIIKKETSKDYPNTRNSSRKDLSIINCDNSSSNSKIAVENSELLSKSARDIIFNQEKNAGNSALEIKTSYANKTKPKNNFYARNNNDNYNNNVNNNIYEINDYVSLRKNLTKDKTRNFGRKMKFTEWNEDRNNNFINNNNTIINDNLDNNKNRFNNDSEGNLYGNASKRIIRRDYNGNGNNHIIVKYKNGNYTEIANSKNKQKINKLKKEKNKNMDILKYNLDRMNDFTNKEKNYKLN